MIILETFRPLPFLTLIIMSFPIFFSFKETMVQLSDFWMFYTTSII